MSPSRGGPLFPHSGDGNNRMSASPSYRSRRDGLANIEDELKGKTDRAKVVEFLGSSVDEDDPEGQNRPEYAINKRKPHELELMLKHVKDVGADLSSAPFNNLLKSAINLATQESDDILDLLLHNLELLGPTQPFDGDDEGLTPLHHAATQRMPKVFELLGKCQPEATCKALRKGDENGLTPLHAAVRVENNVDVVRKIIQLCPDSIASQSKDNSTPLHGLVRRKKLKTVHARVVEAMITCNDTTKAKVLESLSMMDNKKDSVMSVLDPIRKSQQVPMEIWKMLEEILLESSFTPDALCVAFYGQNDGPQPALDLSRFPRSSFVSLMEDMQNIGVRFRDHMHSITFPDLSCNGEKPCHVPLDAGEPLLLRAVRDGMKDMGMKTLRKLVVKDCPRHPHSDKTIQAIIQGLKLKNLNWSKKDISIRGLYQTSPDLEHLHLYSSGHRDILGFWSSELGLHRFKKLKSIHVTIQRNDNFNDQELDDIKNEFEKALLALKHHECREGEVHQPNCWCPVQFRPEFLVVELEPKPLVPRHGSDRPRERPSWSTREGENNIYAKLEPTILRFFGGLRDNNSREARAVNEPEQFIKIAVIDSGVAPSAPELCEAQSVSGRSFVKTLSDDTQWFTPIHFHGTMVASLIRMMNPYTKIYAAKVYAGSDQGGVDVGAAIEAFQWAIDQEVDIICASWSIPSSGGRAQDLNNKLSDVAAKNILIFAAIDDNNPDSDVLPAHSGSAIAVTAATRAPSRIAEGQVVFAIPSDGIDVFLPKYMEPTAKRKTGGESSYATALAAGLASLLLSSVRYAFNLHASADNNFNELKGLKTMKKVFEKLALRGSNNCKLVEPWEHIPATFKGNIGASTASSELKTLLRSWANIQD